MAQLEIIGVKTPDGGVLLRLPAIAAVYIRDQGDPNGDLRLTVHTTGGEHLDFDGDCGRDLLRRLLAITQFVFPVDGE